jgi:hypothetical protein
VGFVSFGERERGEMGSQLMRRVNFSSQKKKVMKRGGFRPAYAGRFDGRKVRFRFHMSCGPSDPTVDGCDEVCTYEGIVSRKTTSPLPRVQVGSAQQHGLHL